MSRSLKVDQIADAIITIPGVFVEALDVTASTNRDLSNGSWADITDFSGSFNAPIAGDYEFTCITDGIMETGVAFTRFGLRLNVTGATTVTVGGTASWESTLDSGQRSTPIYKVKVNLNAGDHSIQLQGYNQLAGTGQARLQALYSRVYVTATSVTGSGAGGTLVDSAIKTGADQVIGTGTTPTKITDLDLGFTLSQDDHVDIYYKVIGSNASATPNSRVLLYRIDGGSWEGLEPQYGAYGKSHSGVFTLTTLPAGYHTVEFGYECNTNSTSIRGNSTFLGNTGFESKTWAIQYRGGLVPIQENGETKVDKPAAFNFKGSVTVENNGGTADILMGDTKPPLGIWQTGGTTINFQARGGQPSVVRRTLQDGKQRTLENGTWSHSNGVAEWGYDDASSQGGNKWLYFYAVPKASDDSKMVIVASDNPLSTGPIGYTNYEIVWKALQNVGNDLKRQKQINNRFYLAFGQQVYLSTSTAAFAWTSISNPYIPLGTGAAMIRVHVNSDGAQRYGYTVAGHGAAGATDVAAQARSGNAGEMGAGMNDGEAEIYTDQTLYHQLVLNSGSGNCLYVEMVSKGWVDEEIEA